MKALSFRSLESTIFHFYKKKKPGIITVFLIDTKLEEHMGLGTAWPFDRPEPGIGYLHKTLSNILRLTTNTTVYVRFEISSFVRHAWKATFPLEDDDGDMMFKGLWDVQHADLKHEVVIPIVIAGTWTDSGGKFPTDTTGLVLDYDTFLPYASKFLDESFWTKDDKERLAQTDLKSYARTL